MALVKLTVKSTNKNQQIEMKGNHLTLGSGASANVVIPDPSLSKIHASIHQENNKIWILNENPKSSCFVNNIAVPAKGLPLNDGDQIKLSNSTFIDVATSLASTGRTASKSVNKSESLTNTDSQSILLKIIVAMVSGIFIISSLIWVFTRQPSSNKVVTPTPTIVDYTTKNDELKTPEPSESVTPSPTPSPSLDTNSSPVPSPSPTTTVVTTEPTPRKVKLYQEMSEEEKLEFVDRQAQHIAMMMGNRPYAFTDDVLRYIKKYLDGYAQRANTTSTKLWGENLPSLYGRASRYAPDIIKAFNARGIPPVVGLYIVMIETEYHDCLESPVGAKGLFQFMPETARGYGVDPNDRCDVKKMSPAAAHYIADRITEFGPDAMSVALGIAGYNRSPDSVRRDLHDVINSNNRERSFWTLVANSDKLDRPFQNENIKYVPKFFAAAIVGETPWAFGLKLKPLSTYSESL